jgi:hypothetical protein
MDKTRVSEAVPNALAGLVRMIDDMDRRYFVLALELGAEEGWDFRLGDIKRVEAMWGMLDGDATSYGFVVELRDGRRAYFDYDNYSEDEFVEHVSMQPMGAERLPRLDGSTPYWDDDLGELNRRLGFTN